MAGPIARVVACAVALSAGCEPAPPAPRLDAMSPARGYTDRSLRVILRGDRFVPSLHLDLDVGGRVAETTGFRGWVGSGASFAPLSGFGWRSDRELSATLAPGLPAGLHPVVLVDPRGSTSELRDGFTSLGPDRTPPTVEVLRPAPGSPLAPGGPLRGTLELADEGTLGSAAWQVDAGGKRVGAAACPVTPETRNARCDFELILPRELHAGDLVELQAQATDSAEPANTLTVRREFTLGEPPGIAQVLPARGGTGGGTEVVVRGTRFLPGSQIYFGRALLSPDGGIHLDERTITGRTPAHPKGAAEIRVVTPVGEGRLVGGFEYLAPPLVLAVEPAQGPRSGGFPLRVVGANFTGRTRIHLGPALRSAVALGQPLQTSDQEILSLAPAGPAADGPVTVFAVDPDAGVGSLAGGFTWMGP